MLLFGRTQRRTNRQLSKTTNTINLPSIEDVMVSIYTAAGQREQDSGEKISQYPRGNLSPPPLHKFNTATPSS